MKIRYLLILLSTTILFSCGNNDPKNTAQTEKPKGKLYIIGGGKRPETMVKEIIHLSGIDKEGYTVILPMSSSEPDTSYYYASKQFIEQGIADIHNFNFKKDKAINQQRIDSLKNAKLIYISGGDQTRFMDIVLNTAIHDAIKEAYKNGSTIAGTSAGAAVMSKKMITGDEFKHPEYTGDFKTIEANNMEITEGLGLVQNAIVDQHFIWRMRMNRLITVALDNPGYYCFGIDESAALVVTPDSVYASGDYQIIMLLNEQEASLNQDELMGGKNLRLDVYLPGEKIHLPIQ